MATATETTTMFAEGVADATHMAASSTTRELNGYYQDARENAADTTGTVRAYHLGYAWGCRKALR